MCNCPYGQCRCKSVKGWLDNHEKYFKKPAPPQEKAVSFVSSKSNDASTSAAHKTQGPRQVSYGPTGDIKYTQQAVRLPYTMQPPFRISPVKPNLKPKK